MDKFNIESIPIQWVAKKLSADEEERYIENLAMRIILAYQELTEKKKSKKNDVINEFNKTPEEYLGLEQYDV